jgi:hypothetical protein
VTEGVIADPAGSEIFDASDDGTIVGPIKNDDGYYLFKVTKVTPEETQPLDTVRQQISQQLVQQAQQSTMTTFVKSYNAKWTSRTFCADGYTTSRCSNFKGDGRVEGADPACYKAGAGDPAKPLVCPASVFQLKPALPGSSTVLARTVSAAAASDHLRCRLSRPQRRRCGRCARGTDACGRRHRRRGSSRRQTVGNNQAATRSTGAGTWMKSPEAAGGILGPRAGRLRRPTSWPGGPAGDEKRCGTSLTLFQVVFLPTARRAG